MVARRKASKPTPKRRNIPPGASPITGTVPPVEHRFQPGNTIGARGRPRKLAELRDLIIEILAEEVTIADADGKRSKITRAVAMIRTMLIKSPSDRIALLEYAFGKVPTSVNLSGEVVSKIKAYNYGEAIAPIVSSDDQPAREQIDSGKE